MTNARCVTTLCLRTITFSFSLLFASICAMYFADSARSDFSVRCGGCIVGGPGVRLLDLVLLLLLRPGIEQ